MTDLSKPSNVRQETVRSSCANLVEVPIVARLRGTDVQRRFELEGSKVTEFTALYFAPEVTPRREAQKALQLIKDSRSGVSSNVLLYLSLPMPSLDHLVL